jgi:hypothetical protein
MLSKLLRKIFFGLFSTVPYCIFFYFAFLFVLLKNRIMFGFITLPACMKTFPRIMSSVSYKGRGNMNYYYYKIK